MRCLIIGLLILSVVIGAIVWVWMTYGFWTVAGVFVGGYLALWVLSKILPPAAQRFFGGMFDNLAGPMKEAQVEVLRVEKADESERVQEELIDFDEWLKEELAEGGDDLIIDAHDAFFHDTTGELMSDSYLIELSISPPEPDTAWTPHGLGFRPVEEPTTGSGEIVEFRITDDLDGELKPFNPEEAYQEVTGARRLELLVRMPTGFREYKVEYLHGDHWDTVVTLPPAPEEPFHRQLTAAVVERLSAAENLSGVSFWGMPVSDADVARLCGLANLKGLDLSSTSITDAAVQHLQRMTQLRDLSVNGTTLSAVAIAQLKSSLPDTNIQSQAVNPFG